MVKNIAINNVKIIKNKVWLFTARGVFVYIYDGNKFTLDTIFLQGKDTTDAIQDKQGYFWFTTLNSGIYIIPSEFIFEVKRKFIDEYITDFEVMGNHNIAYIEGNKFLSIFNTETSNVKTKELKSFNQKMFYDNIHEKLLVFVGEELNVYDCCELNTVRKYQEFPTPKNIIRISENKLLATYYNRVDLIDTDTYTISERVLSRSRFLAFNLESKLIYVDFSKGLKVGSTLKNLKKVKYKGQNLYVNSITSQPETKNTYVLVSRHKILKLEGTVVTDSINFKKNTNISTIVSDKDNLWIGTIKGLLKYSYKNKKINSLGKIGNLHINKISSKGDFIWVVSGEKIIRIPKKNNTVSSQIGKPYFKMIKIDGERVQKDAIISVNKNSSISFRFMINGFNNLSLYDLEYHIPNEKWRYISGNELTLSGLPFGTQTIKVRGIHKETSQKTSISSVNIKVIRPFYAKWWFLVLCFLVLLAVLYIMIRIILKKQNKKKLKEFERLQVKQQLSNLKLENLRSQMNPHFLFNALNSIQEYIYNSEKELASSYLVKFSRLMRIYLDHSRVSEISLFKEIEALKLYLSLENNRFEEALDFQIVLGDDINSQNIVVPTLFIQPYVENAIKHGLLHKKGAKKLSVTFNLNSTKDELKVSVKDNGIGIEASTVLNANRYNHKSFATNANFNRVKLMNLSTKSKIKVDIVDLKDNDNNTTGTEVIILIPIN